jgi:phosphoserine phosphatase
MGSVSEDSGRTIRMTETTDRREPLDLVLVRHGKTDWNEQGRLMGRAEIGLNARGRSQARAAARALARMPLRSVVASPQRRAQETAALIAAPHGIAVETEADLAEVWVGAWQGKSFTELAGDPDILRYFQDPTYVCEAIEPMAAVRDRVIRVAGRLAASERAGAVALVSHGDPLRALLSHWMGVPLDHIRKFTVATGSISIVRFGAWRTRVVLLNWRPGGVGQSLLD